MRTYHYRGYAADGSARQGRIDAESVKPALRELTAQGIFVEHIRLAGPARKGLRAERRAALYRELATLLKAGIPLERALGLLMDSAAGGDAGAELAPVRDAVREGQPLATALAQTDGRMDDYEKAAVLAAERTATLPEILLTLAEYQEERGKALEKLRSAAIYPCFVLVLGLAVAFLMLGLLVPRTQAALSASGVALPPASLAVVSVARVVAYAAGALTLLAVLAGVAVSGLCHRDEQWRLKVDRVKLSIPWVGRRLAALAAARFASTLAVLARAGVPLVEGVGLAGQATGNRWLAAWIGRQAERVRHGEALSTALSEVQPLTPSLGEWVRVGEAGGCLEDMLDVAAQRAQAQWERSVTRVLSLFEPVVLVVVGAFVLAVALAVLMPITSLLNISL
jgi:general secretion pathway protein F